MNAESKNNVPKHVAIMMDGNGRWAKRRMLPRKMGHVEGGKLIEDICASAYKLGVKYLTVYAFSPENWNRPKDEVEGIMNLFRKYLAGSIDKSLNNNIRVRIIGNRKGLATDIVEEIGKLEEATKKCNVIPTLTVLKMFNDKYGAPVFERGKRNVRRFVEMGGKKTQKYVV